MPAAIAFQSVSKRFRNGTLALDGASWSVATGSRTCLLGPNGAGKSTSVRLLQGALEPTAGSVELLGATGGSPGYREARRQTGIVAQGPGMYTDLTVGEYMWLAARLYGTRPDQAVEVFGLGPYQKTRMAQLSGGWQRRLVLAAALVAEPEVLLLDEPTVGLDPVAAHDVHQYLKRFMRGRTALLCTHNLAEAEALCDQVVILNEGRVILQGGIEDLRRRQRPRLRLAARQGIEALQSALNGAAVEVEGDAVLVEVTDPRSDAPELLARLLAGGVEVYECTPVQPTLHDLFLEALS